jgi:hypothetical protein
VFENWLLHALNILLPTVAVILMYLAQRRLVARVESLPVADQKLLMLGKHHKSMSIAIALLAAWLVVQYLPLIM